MMTRVATPAVSSSGGALGEATHVLASFGSCAQPQLTWLHLPEPLPQLSTDEAMQLVQPQTPSHGLETKTLLDQTEKVNVEPSAANWARRASCKERGLPSRPRPRFRSAAAASCERWACGLVRARARGGVGV